MPWSAQIHTAFHVCRITQEHPRVALDFGYGDFTLYVGTFQVLHLSIVIPHRGPTTPETSLRFGLFRFRSPLLTESILFIFLRILRCFTSPRVALSRLCIHLEVTPNYRCRVSPFGHLRIKACMPLPEAYRSLARPSSPVSTKASTVCPLKLDSLFEISHA